MDFVEACRKLISIDSTPSQGNGAAARFVSDLCQAKGLFVETQEEFWADHKQANVLARPKAERPALEFMLQAHLDTSDPGPFGLWVETEQNPFDAHIIDGKIHGLGAADVKLDFLCKLEALASFPKDVAWRLPPVLVGTFGEETGMAGALKLIRKNKIVAKMALIGEPSDLAVITAGKGVATVEIRVPFEEHEKKYREDHNLRESTSTQSRIFTGRAAHSSTPHLGDSAIKKMLDYLLQLPEGIMVMEMDGGVNFNTVPAHAFLELDLISGQMKSISKKVGLIYRTIQELEDHFLQHVDQEFEPAHPTLNIGIVRTFEDHIFISGSCRVPPSVNHEAYEAWMKHLSEVCREVQAEFRVTDYKRPFRTDAQSVFVKGCLDELASMGLAPELRTQSSTNEASLFSRVGVECISFGPGKREGNIHTPQEHVRLEDLKKATEFYRRVIERFCL